MEGKELESKEEEVVVGDKGMGEEEEEVERVGGDASETTKGDLRRDDARLRREEEEEEEEGFGVDMDDDGEFASEDADKVESDALPFDWEVGEGVGEATGES